MLNDSNVIKVNALKGVQHLDDQNFSIPGKPIDLTQLCARTVGNRNGLDDGLEAADPCLIVHRRE